MKVNDMQSLNVSDLDVETLEKRLEMSLLLHPMLWDCGTNNDTCKGKVSIE